jgi:hypothetical protein
MVGVVTALSVPKRREICKCLACSDFSGKVRGDVRTEEEPLRALRSTKLAQTLRTLDQRPYTNFNT